VNFKIKYCKAEYILRSVDRATICGKTFSHKHDIEVEANIMNKINKLEKKLNIWLQRDLSFEGKIIIVKTFGISQLIYSMQNQYFEDSHLRSIEQIMYQFIWAKGGKLNNPERIKRNILKNTYFNGGMRAPDMTSIDLSLKTKYFLDKLRVPENDVSIVTDIILKNSNNPSRKSYFFNEKNVTDKFIKKNIIGINLIFKLFERDLESNLNTGTKLSRRYADCVSTINIANYKAKKYL